MKSNVASSSTLLFEKSCCESYGKLRYLHKEGEKDFVAWVKARSPFLQKLNRNNIWLQTLEREFHRIKEPLPRNIVDELVVIVEAREKAKVIHVANGSHDKGHENCLQMYKCFLRKALESETPLTQSSQPPPPPPSPTSDDDFPPIGSTSSFSLRRHISTKRPYSAIHPPSTRPSVLRTGSVKKQRLVLKPRSTSSTNSGVAAC